MHSETISRNENLRRGKPSESSSTAPRWLQKLLQPLSEVSQGSLILTLPSGETLAFGDTGEPQAAVTIHRWRALRRVMTGGTLGWSEAYLDSDWDSPDITALVRWALINEERLSEVFEGNWLSKLIHRFRHRRNANSKRGSRKNIAFHYDLGNDFYRLWLDPSMTYSSARYSQPSQPLAQAQREKYQAMIDRLDIRDGDRVLEIGCGWGGFAEQLCSKKAAHLEGITLSQEQLAFARQRISDAGLEQQASFSLTDYRDTAGEYDHIVSIEMLEAVGREYWPSYFQTLYSRLKPGGRAAIQVITIDESRFEGYCDSPDFIQTYIFPGGMLPSIERVQQHSQRAGLNWLGTEAFGKCYARTLAEWNRNFHARWDEIAAQGFDDRFKRLWRYYLEYCEGGFLAGSIDVHQLYLEKPSR